MIEMALHVQLPKYKCFMGSPARFSRTVVQPVIDHYHISIPQPRYSELERKELLLSFEK